MTNQNASPEDIQNFESLLAFLETDPENLALISDTAEAAITAGKPKQAKELLETYAAISSLPEKEIGIAGLAAMQLKEFELAADYFETLLPIKHSDPAIRFNLAWCRSMLKDYTGAKNLLNEDTSKDLPQAAMLEVQILHQLGEFEKAAERASKLIEIHPEHRGLLAATSVISMDVENSELAKKTALAAGDHPDALTTLGTLALGDDQSTEALELFDRSLKINDKAPRSWIGKGLAQLTTGDHEGAAENLDKGAEIFGTHLGSWIAAGWAYFTQNDLETSRARFEKALEIDPNFAESHGALAVLDVYAGENEQARQRVKTAMRLDKECFSAALAQVLMISAQGNPEAAQKIFDKAINTPIDESGRTIAQSLVRLGSSPEK